MPIKYDKKSGKWRINRGPAKYTRAEALRIIKQQKK